jgi:arsenate reductase
VADEAIVEARLVHTILVNRPLGCSHQGVRLCRPSQTVRDLLEGSPPGPLFKKDRAPIIDEEGGALLETPDRFPKFDESCF